MGPHRDAAGSSVSAVRRAGGRARQVAIEVDKRKIQIEEPIKLLGEFDIAIRLHRDVVVTVKLDVGKGG